MKKVDQHISIQQNQIMSLLYLVFVLFLFGQHTPYQSLVQEPVQKGFQKASIDYFNTVAFAGSSVEFDQSKSKIPFGSSNFPLSSSSSFTAVPFPQVVYKQAFKSAVSEFLAIKPLLIQRWQIEQFSHQTNPPFIV